MTSEAFTQAFKAYVEAVQTEIVEGVPLEVMAKVTEQMVLFIGPPNSAARLAWQALLAIHDAEWEASPHKKLHDEERRKALN